jgi:nitrogen fixation protein FixH
MRTQRRSLIPLLFPLAMLPMFAANGTLIYLALHNRPTLVSEHPYEDGRAYNRELAAAAAQNALGWTVVFMPANQVQTPTPVTFEVTGRDGAPVTGLHVDLRVWRPVGAINDLLLTLAETRPGHYTASVTLAAGQWQFDIVARRGEQEFAFARRVTVP